MLFINYLCIIVELSAVSACSMICMKLQKSWRVAF